MSELVSGGPQLNASTAERYTRIIADLSELEVAACWAAVLYGKTPHNGSLAARIVELSSLRDAVGKTSAAKNTERSEAA